MLRIRHLRAADVADWSRLRSSVWPDCTAQDNRQEFAAQRRSTRCHTLVADHSAHGVIAFVELAIRAVADGCATTRIAYIEGIFVAPRFRRAGIAERLLQRAAQWARRQRCLEMASDCHLHNQASLRLHRHGGFQVMHRLITFRKALPARGIRQRQRTTSPVTAAPIRARGRTAPPRA